MARESEGEVMRLDILSDENMRLQAQVTELQTRMSEVVNASQNRRVRAFMAMVGQDMPTSLCVPSDDVVRLRLRLVAEEFFELLEASLGVWPLRPWTLEDAKGRVALAIECCPVKVDLPEFVDALADIDYVVEGSRVACGVLGEPVAALVHAANMSKHGGPLDEDGKAGKPAGWAPPDVAGGLRRQGWTT